MSLTPPVGTASMASAAARPTLPGWHLSAARQVGNKPLPLLRKNRLLF